MKKISVCLFGLFILAGCAGQEMKEQPKAAIEGRVLETATSATKSLDQNAVDALALKDPNNILSKRSIYYDYDKDSVKDVFKPLVEAHSKYLSSHKDAKIAVQGNCDERGSREYNIALGNRRADSVKKMMGMLGASDSQVEAVSFGEEKPRASCHNESCWKENRRSDIVYRGE